jgi:hypothetical protein
MHLDFFFFFNRLWFYVCYAALKTVAVLLNFLIFFAAPAEYIF